MTDVRPSPRPRAVLLAFAFLLQACGGKDASGPRGGRSTDFYVAFPANADLNATASLSVRVTGAAGVTGTVSAPGLTFTSVFTTDTGGVAVVTVPAGATLDAWDQVEARGVLVHANDSVSVLAISDKAGSMSATPVPPSTVLGTTHAILTAGSGGASDGSFVALVATADSTTVTITPSVAAGARAAGTPYQVTLNSGDAYQVEATGTAGDLSGTLVSSNKKVGVFAGHIAGQIPGGDAFAGLLWVAVPPTTAIQGMSYVTLALTPRSEYRVRVMGLADGTSLTSSGFSGMATTVNAGQWVEATATGMAQLTSDKAVIAAQVAEGGAADNVDGADPCLTLLPPVTAYHKGYTFAVPQSQVGTMYANIVSPVSATGSVKLNGSLVAANLFVTIGTSGYAGATVPLTGRVERLTSTGGAPFGLVAYGWDAAGGANGVCYAPGTGS